jgi:hypothetical protein
MKTLGLVFGVLAASLSCTAQPSAAIIASTNKFVICQDGAVFCKISMLGVGPGEGPTEIQELIIQDGRRLQQYLNLLSDCHIPIEKVQTMPKDQRIPFTIVMDTRPIATFDPHALVYVRGRTLFLTDREPRYIRMADNDSQRARIERPRGAWKRVLDEFGQKCFGVPVSAIDDPNYQWPEKKSTLVIDVDKFEAIVYPLKPH